MRRCERCGRYYYFDSCPYCELTSEHGPGKKTLAYSGYFWIVILFIGIIGAIMDPSSIIPVAGMLSLIWVISRLGAKGFGKKRKMK